MLTSRVLGGKGEIRSEYLGTTIKDLLNKTFEIPEQYDAVIVEVDDEYKARPDLFAKDICGDESYAEIICKLNGVSNPFEFQSGTYMLVPDLNSLSKFIIQPATGWNGGMESESSSSSSSQPVPKSKTDRRKPNEAITGDSRFNIDPVSKIVIY